MLKKTTLVPLILPKGFIRQIIGWREFIKRYLRVLEERTNVPKPVIGTLKEIPASFYLTVLQAFFYWPNIKRYYKRVLPPIERLMVLGNFMICSGEFDQTKFNKDGFMGTLYWCLRLVIGHPIFTEWVQFADGGLTAYETLLSGSNYLIENE